MSSEKLTPKNVLIVEDEAIVAQDARMALEKFGYRVTGTVDTGDAAILAVKKERPDLVIMDIRLKGDMDGIETAGRLSEGSIPVIYITGYGDKETIDRAKKTCPGAIVHKPFDDQELYSAIELALYTHEIEDALKKKNKELEAANRLMVGRELKMIELKKKIKELEDKTSKI